MAAWAVYAALCYLPDLAPPRSITFASMTLFWSFFTMTMIILCDQVTLLFEHRSLLDETTGNRAGWRSLIAIGALSGVLLDGVAQWLGKLWIYPYWNEAVYGTTFIIGFCAYWLVVTETYLAVKAILRRLSPPRIPAAAPRNSGKELFRALAVAGAALTIAGTILLLRDYRSIGGYVFEIRKPLPVRTHFGYFLMAFSGVWLLLEWVQFQRRSASLVSAALHGDRAPLYSLLIASGLFSVFMETVNSAHHFWMYTNWPGSTWMGVPVAVLATWPLQYVVFLSLGWLLPNKTASWIWS